MKTTLQTKILIGLGALIFIAAASYGIVKLSSHKANYQIATPSVRELTEPVTATGKVKAADFTFTWQPARPVELPRWRGIGTPAVLQPAAPRQNRLSAYAALTKQYIACGRLWEVTSRWR